MSAATEVFRLPELCAIIFDYLSNEEIYRLQNLSRGSRGYLSDSKSWKERILHHASYDGETVVPRLHQAREGDNEDPKKVDWVYTSGEFEGGVVRSLGRRLRWPAFPVTPEIMTPGYIRAGSMILRPLRRINSDPDAMSSSINVLGNRTCQAVQTVASASSSATPSSVPYSAAPSSATPSSATPSSAPISSTIPASATLSSTSTSLVIPSSSSTETAQVTMAPISQANTQYTPQFGRRNRGSAYSTHQTQMQGVMLNWVLEAKFPKWKYYPISNMLGLEQEVPMDEFFITSDASYRPLFLMYPPLSEVTVMDWQSRIFEVTNERGVTMGDVVDALMRGEAENIEAGSTH